jgi:hypothetical protein
MFTKYKKNKCFKATVNLIVHALTFTNFCKFCGWTGMLLVGRVFTVIVDVLFTRTINFAIVATLSKATHVVDERSSQPACTTYATSWCAGRCGSDWRPCTCSTSPAPPSFGYATAPYSYQNMQFPVQHAVNLMNESSHYFNMHRLVPPSNRVLATHMILQ